MIFICMKKKPTYKEIKEAEYIMKMMEDVFGHRITSWSPKDTIRLKGKLSQPVTDKEKEHHVSVVEPLMKKRSFIPPRKDQFLDSFIDLDTRISQSDYEVDKEDQEQDSVKSVKKSLKTDLT